MSLSTASLKISKFVSGNLLGSAICIIQNRSANIEQHPYFLCDESIIEYNIIAHIVRIYNLLGSWIIAFILDISGTMVVQAEKISHKYRAIF